MITNYQVADALALLSKLMDIHGENAFKSKSYAAAAFQIEKLPLQLAEMEPAAIASVKGIGESNARKVVELLQTGRLAQLQQLIERTPPGVLDMLQIKGLGPKKIATIWKEMDIESIGELLYACEENRLMRYKGFGEKTQTSIKESIEFFLRNKDIHLYADVEAYALKMDNQLQQAIPGKRWSLTGAIRRQLETIEQLEWVTTATAAELTQLFGQVGLEAVTDTATVDVVTPEHIRLRFYLADDTNFGSQLFLTSGSPAFLEGWGDVPAAAEEHLIFEQRNHSPVPAFLREEWPVEPPADLIDPGSIKGLIHCHSNWSDGSNTIEEMARECIRRGWEYMVISDHSKSAGYANGLSVERIREQHLQVDELNQRLQPFRIFKSIEADILGDGSLDYDDEVLSTFDLVIASVHSNLRMPQEKAMARLMTAIENPYTTILGHMTGRLLLSRNGYPLDHEAIIDACVANQVVIELNAHPRRLDIDWRWIPYAMKKGAILSINPDAHELAGFDDVKFGAIAARKGRLTNSRNLSSYTRTQMEAFITTNRMEKGI